MAKQNIKLIILPIIIIVSMIILSFLFSQKIDRLKKEVDLIYFGNFTPVDTLHNIKSKFLTIIYEKKISKNNLKYILKNWKTYYTGYKTDEEIVRLNKIDKQLKIALNSNNLKLYHSSLNNINLLIKHEVNSAYIQRKEFLQQYKDMQNYLFYAQLIIITLVLIFSAFVVYKAIKQNSYLKHLNEQYKVEANTDALTNLYNRKYFDTIFDDLVPISRQNNWISVFIMIDIDFFKQFNDTYGHDAGDIALKKVSGVLDILINKEYEYPFRLGGEEFGIIIFNTNEKYVRYTLNNIQHHIKEQKIVHSASKTGYLTLSMGVTMIDKNGYNLSTKKIYTSTDEKLYHSKENGRDQYTF